MRALGRNELTESNLIREGDKIFHVCKTIFTTNKGNNESPRP